MRLQRLCDYSIDLSTIKWTGKPFPMPNSLLVGIKGLGTLK